MADPFADLIPKQQQGVNPFADLIPQGRSLGESTARGFGLTAQGINDSIANLIGIPGELAKAGIPILPTDIVVAGAKKLGVNLPIGSPTGADVQKGMDFISTLPRRAVDAVSGAPEPQGGYSSRVTPESGMERFVYGAGRGVGDVAGQFAGAGLVAPAAGVAGGVARSLMTAPGTQLAANAVGSGVGEATQNPLYGLAAALGTGAVMEAGKPVARYLAAPGRSNLNEVEKRLAGVLADEGVPLRTGQMTGSRGAQGAEAVLERLPISGAMAGRDIQNQREMFTAAALKRAGIDSKSAAPEVLAARKEQLGKVFDQITSRTDVPVDNAFVQRLINIADSYEGKIPQNTKTIVKTYIDQLSLPKGGGPITGEEYQRTRSLLRNQAQGFKNSDYTSYRALKDVRNALDEAFARNVSPGDSEAFRIANRQYANLKTIEDAMNRAGTDVGRGILTPGALEIAAKKAAKGLYSTGAGDLNELARAGSVLMKDKIANSGTPERLAWQSALTGGAWGLGGFDPATLAATIAAPPIAEKVLQSDMMKRYLMKSRGTNQTDIQGLLAAALAERLRDPNTKAIR